jgi:hypothetical protein
MGKKKKKARKAPATQVILMPDDDPDAKEEDSDEEVEDDDESGIYLDKESIQIIYNALKEYKPAAKEEHVYSVLFEQFEEMLVVDYGVRLPGFAFMDEEEDEN